MHFANYNLAATDFNHSRIHLLTFSPKNNYILENVFFFFVSVQFFCIHSYSNKLLFISNAQSHFTFSIPFISEGITKYSQFIQKNHFHDNSLLFYLHLIEWMYVCDIFDYIIVMFFLNEISSLPNIERLEMCVCDH